jgi:dihydroxyacetone kinase-like predicted kinase
MITISIVPKITELITYDDSELQMRLTNQNNEIVNLNGRIGELSRQVIDNQRECINEIIRRETEILGIINEIDSYARKSKKQTHLVVTEPYINKEVILNDTIEVLMSSPKVTSTVVETKQDEKLIKMINHLKKKVSEDINQ